MFNFEGKFAVVTGGAKGIGEGIVRQLINDNIAGVAVLDMLEVSYAKDLDPSGEKILPIICNIAVREEVSKAFAQIYEKFGRVDFMINNAGIARDAMFHKMSWEEWDAVLNVDLGGGVNCTREVINGMREQESGRIIFVASISVYGNAGQSNYSAAKGALLSLTKTLARESNRKNITVNCIIPGGVATDMTAHLPSSNNPNPSNTGVHRGQPEDIASLICYLCTDEAIYINGSCIDINGGSH